MPLIRLEDGTHIAPGDETVAFLPTEPPSGYPNTVHPAVCDTGPAWKFFAESVGLRTPDLVDDIVSDVLPRYCEAGFTIADDEYVADLQRFVSVYATDSRERSRRLVAALRDTPFVLAADAATCEQSFVRPADAYLAADRLRALFDGVPGVLLVDDLLDWKEVTDLLRACEVWRALAPVDVGHRFTQDQRREVRRRAGREWEITPHRGETVMDGEFRGLRGLLEYLPELSREDAQDRARILWDALREADQSSFRGRYEWFYRTWRRHGFDSSSVRLLNETAWVPDGSGDLQPPYRVEFASLGWRRNEFLESIIKFRRPEPLSEVAVLAKAADVDRGSLEAVKEAQDAGLSPEAIRQTLRREARRQRILADPSPRGDDGSAGVGANSSGERAAEGATSGADAADDGRQARDPDDEPSSGGERVFESYIRVVRESVATEEGRREQARRTGLEDDAIALIQKQEPSLKGTRRDNPGFDLYEAGEDGEPVRWVEVKAMSGRWESHAATLTPTEFDYARKKGEAYWLYVVEHAGTERAKIARINDPAGWDSWYTFDHGWRAAAEGTEGDD